METTEYQLAIITVLEFPPRLSLSSHVSSESRYGMKTLRWYEAELLLDSSAAVTDNKLTDRDRSTKCYSKNELNNSRMADAKYTYHYQISSSYKENNATAG